MTEHPNTFMGWLNGVNQSILEGIVTIETGSRLLHVICENHGLPEPMLLKILKLVFKRFPTLNMDPVNDMYRTPLMCALEQEKNQLAKFLIAMGANLNAVNLFSQSIWEICKFTGNNDILSILKLHGVGLDSKDTPTRRYWISASLFRTEHFGLGYEYTSEQLLYGMDTMKSSRFFKEEIPVYVNFNRQNLLHSVCHDMLFLSSECSIQEACVLVKELVTFFNVPLDAIDRSGKTPYAYLVDCLENIPFTDLATYQCVRDLCEWMRAIRIKRAFKRTSLIVAMKRVLLHRRFMPNGTVFLQTMKHFHGLSEENDEICRRPLKRPRNGKRTSLAD
jgi:hypothetical protein